MSGRQDQDSTGHGGGEAGGLHAHREAAPRSLAVAVVTVSDTRTLATDTGGASIADALEGAGHSVARRTIVPDEIEAIRAAVTESLDDDGVVAVIVTGGTGVAPRDVTPEAIAPLLDREVPGFGELFRMLSFEEIGPAAMLSRAFAGLRGEKVVIALPGSRGAIRLAMERLVLPEIGHLVGEGGKHVGLKP